ncbi:MAG TPA: hypothetical protein VFA05_11955 [Gaiellaceae bacterium]|nr:hypothetical protein [Gaiellaceae bacterium]
MSLLASSSFERVVIWLPALVIGCGLVAAVCILLGRAFLASVRDSGHPRLIWGGVVALFGVVVLLTYLGVQLPRE